MWTVGWLVLGPLWWHPLVFIPLRVADNRGASDEVYNRLANWWSWGAIIFGWWIALILAFQVEPEHRYSTTGWSDPDNQNKFPR